jgi:hypothetical protein
MFRDMACGIKNVAILWYVKWLLRHEQKRHEHRLEPRPKTGTGSRHLAVVLCQAEAKDGHNSLFPYPIYARFCRMPSPE